MRIFIVAIVTGLLVYACYFFQDKPVKVINVSFDGYTAQIVVDQLPFSESGKMAWWQRSQKQIRNKYAIPSDNTGPFLITVYAFGKGYQKEGDEDRLCFRNITPPRNCIDKNILMMIWRTREGGTRYDFN
ncbi:DUF943 family protein [Siccibacter turicensis]|uniref:DUF943 family protein n=1 Tax=Siccibacter turicensis TaxID=357233 RepID=UPI001021A315|nr:DUF943 family protein [Siccibacter turicensis]